MSVMTFCTAGWADIGYNFLVDEGGRVYEGRGWDTVGAHVYGHNSRSIGISFIGSFVSRLPNAAGRNAVKQLISCGVSMVRHFVGRITHHACPSACLSVPYGLPTPKRKKKNWCEHCPVQE